MLKLKHLEKANKELVSTMKDLMDNMILQQRDEHNTFLRLAIGKFSLGNSNEKKEDK